MNRRNINKNPVILVITYIANMTILNMLFIVTSIPIFTIGVSWSSMFSVTRELSKGDTFVVTSYFKYFKEQFKQSTKCWLIIMLVLLIFYVEWVLLSHLSIEVPFYVYAFMIIPLLFLSVYIPWVLIQSSYFTLTLKQQFMNAFLFQIKFVPQSIVILIFVLFPIISFIFRPDIFLIVWPLWLFLYFATTSSCIAAIIKIPFSYITDQFKK